MRVENIGFVDSVHKGDTVYSFDGRSEDETLIKMAEDDVGNKPHSLQGSSVTLRSIKDTAEQQEQPTLDLVSISVLNSVGSHKADKNHRHSVDNAKLECPSDTEQEFQRCVLDSEYNNLVTQFLPFEDHFVQSEGGLTSRFVLILGIVGCDEEDVQENLLSAMASRSSCRSSGMVPV